METEEIKEATMAEQATAAPALEVSSGGARAKSPGDVYVNAYLPNDREAYDRGALAELIDEGAIIACPGCHFLRLPRLPFPSETITASGEKAPDTSCDVCLTLAQCPRDAFCGFERGQDELDDAAATLSRARCQRAAMLYGLWIGATYAADALKWSAMADSLNTLHERVQSCLSTGVSGERSA